MAKDDFGSTLYKNCRNLTIEVIDYGMHDLTSGMKSIEVKDSFKFTILNVLKFWANY